MKLFHNTTTALPPLYAAWMDELLAGPIPPETGATCDDCAMCAKTGEQPTGTTCFFDPRVKCCSYMPALHNFLVGRIFQDNDPAYASGRATVEARLAAGVAVTPLGLDCTPTYSLLYAHKDADVFGRSFAMRCPHYLEEEGGRCGVWQHRAAVCATWFCKHVRGAVGMKFWKTLHCLLATVEQNLSRWCVLELDVGDDALQQLFPPLNESHRSHRLDANVLDGVVEPAKYRTIWGNYWGREQEFYKACARLVDALTWHQVAAICGPDVQIQARLTREAYQRLISHETPTSLKAGRFNVVFLDQDSCCVSTYSSLDPAALPKIVIDLLPYFDGRPTDEVLQTIREQENVQLNKSLVRKLTDFQILVSSENDE